MNRWLTLFLILSLLSCKDFNFKKQSADEILEQELKSINLTKVDFYPTFQTCGVVTSKAESKSCFEYEIKTTIRSRLSQEEISTSNREQDTIVVDLYINAKGEMSIKQVAIPSQVKLENPQIHLWLEKAIHQLPEVYPAQKRSVPVSLHTQIPIILE
jgi:hypothetical protein